MHFDILNSHFINILLHLEKLSSFQQSELILTAIISFSFRGHRHSDVDCSVEATIRREIFYRQLAPSACMGSQSGLFAAEVRTRS